MIKYFVNKNFRIFSKNLKTYKLKKLNIKTFNKKIIKINLRS